MSIDRDPNYYRKQPISARGSTTKPKVGKDIDLNAESPESVDEAVLEASKRNLSKRSWYERVVIGIKSLLDKI